MKISITALARACAIALAVVVQVPLAAQTPQQQPLIHAGNVRNLGYFILPNGGPDSIAIDGDKVLAGYGTCIQTLTLPAIGATAVPLASCAMLPNIDQVHPTDRNIKVGGILPYLGGYVAAGYVYYDASAGAKRSHWKGVSLSSLAGPYTVSTATSVPPGQLGVLERPGMIGGSMGLVPPEWQSLLGGPALTGLCCIPIISRASYGPSVSVFDPAHLDGRASVPSTMMVGYPIEHRNLGPWEGVSKFYGGTNQLGGIAFPAGTRSILFTGRHGESWCYGPGTGDKSLVGTPAPPPSVYLYCYDPTDSYQGSHGPPYAPTMWAYDANDFLAVKLGQKKPWDIQPYEKWTLPGMPIDGVQNLIRAGFYVQSTRRFYVAMNDSNRVWIFEIDGGAQPPPDVACAESSSTWGPDYTTPEGWSACEPVDGIMKKWRSRTWTTTIAKSGNGAACVWTGSGAVGSTFEQVEYVTCDVPPPPPPPVVSTIIDGSILTCRITVSSPAAPAGASPRVQFQRRPVGGAWVNHGSVDTSASGGWLRGPYTVNRGVWEAQALWTVNGVALPPVAAAVAYHCE